jgi:hypothetical protein
MIGKEKGKKKEKFGSTKAGLITHRGSINAAKLETSSEEDGKK